MTLEDCKKMHEIIWHYISNKFIEDNIPELRRSEIINELKKDICTKEGFKLKNRCALCQYAFEKYLHTDTGHDNFCKYCPVIWGTENEASYYPCEYATIKEIQDARENDVYLRHWVYSSSEEIENIKWKDEVE